MRESEQQKEMIEEMKRKLAEKEEEIEEMKRAKEVDADNYNETISRLEAANKKFKIALNDKKTQHEFDMARSVLEIDEERNRLVEKNNKVIAELKEKDDKIQELLNVIDELESKTTSYETEREEVAYSLNEANKALSMKTKTITELQRSISDLQMVNQKLKDLATARAEEIESMKLSIIETEAELKKSIKETEEQLEMKYMEREREMKQDMKNTIAQFKASVENMAKDSEKVGYCSKIIKKQYKAESALLRKQLLQAETAYKDQKAETAKSEALVSGLRNEIFMLENEINRVKAELKDKEENWRFDKEKIEAETKTREQEWKNVIETYENEMKQVKAKYMDLELEFQNTKQELEDANLGLQKSEDVIYNYKSLIESLRGSKDRVVTELETSETRIHELSRAVEVRMSCSQTIIGGERKGKENGTGFYTVQSANRGRKTATCSSKGVFAFGVKQSKNQAQEGAGTQGKCEFHVIPIKRKGQGYRRTIWKRAYTLQASISKGGRRAFKDQEQV
eukprot:TRINITY_DN1172_c0_g1_i1.p2 TRINITY_DN1172_c0_g1~~TRINITY_DN1172_c0_g1_i1.p2  ORF type:complete len:511 (+),score=82.82 TRINITY_DN1172_c0_g1_i1:3074-4606(+)